MNALTHASQFVLAEPEPQPEILRPTHDARFEMRIGGALIGLFVFGFLGWSTVARLDAAIHAPGAVRVAGSRQTVQSATGGVMTAINVREGDHVREGDVLIGFATTETLAQERSLASRVIGLQAEIARINAEQAGVASIAAPAEWSSLDSTEHTDATRALASEQTNLAARRALLASERAVLGERLAQVGEQIGGYRERQKSNFRQGQLNEDELGGVQQLYQKGYATKTRVLALQRSGASIEGDIGATQAEIARLGTSAGETRLQIMQLSDQRDHDNSERLRLAQTELQSLLPQWQAAREQVARSAVRAPVSGTVFELMAHTVGGFAPAGQKLMDLVPSAGALEIESQVATSDANDLHPGQVADVRFSGLRGRNIPVLHGRISRVSADSVIDEHSGRAYFIATVTIPRSQLDAIGREAGIGSIKPGTPADVTVPLRARSALDYWLSPLFSRFRPALSEQ